MVPLSCDTIYLYILLTLLDITAGGSIRRHRQTNSHIWREVRPLAILHV